MAVRAAVASLPRRQREAVILRFLDDRTVVESAEVMGCAPGTVKTHTSRALAALRAMDLDLDLPRHGHVTRAADGQFDAADAFCSDTYFTAIDALWRERNVDHRAEWRTWLDASDDVTPGSGVTEEMATVVPMEPSATPR